MSEMDRAIEELRVATESLRETNRRLRIERGENPDPTLEERRAEVIAQRARNDQAAAELRERQRLA